MANETLGAVRLRTKITGSEVQDSELLAQEIAFGNTEKVTYIKDYDDNVHRYLPTDDAATTVDNAWSATQIYTAISTTGRLTTYDDIWSEAEHLAIDPPPLKGDIVVRQDIARSYIQNGGSVGDMTDWSEILTPGSVAGTVTSINGQQGVVVLTTDGISEGSTNLYYTDARVSAHTEVTDAYTHVFNDGSDHTFIDQDVTSGAAPVLDGTNITNLSVTNAESITVNARKATAGTIPVNRPVFFVSRNVGGWIEVEEAYSSDEFRMPAIGITASALTDSATSQLITDGILESVNTSGFSVRDELFVGNFGGLTNSRPTNGNIIQVIAQTLESDIAGSISLINSGLPKNDLPRLETGRVWQGDADNIPSAVNLLGVIDTYMSTYTGSTTITTVGTITTGTWAAGTIDGGTF